MQDIKPSSILHKPLDNETMKVTFKLFDDKSVSIIYDPNQHMFNATQFLTEFGYDVEKFKRMMRTVDLIYQIDMFSFYRYECYHYSYKGETIWQDVETVTIKAELRDSSYNVLKSKLEEKDDNVVKRDENNTAFYRRGTWLHYELMFDVLMLISPKYRQLVRHYQTTILPLLTIEGISFESHVYDTDSAALIGEAAINELKAIPEPFKKGSRAEHLVAEGLSKVFDKVEIVSNHPHTCDILLPTENILVEVKAKVNDTAANNEKFVNDILSHQNTINMGIYVNLLDDSLKTHIEFNPLRFYINRFQFTRTILNIIKETNRQLNRVIISTKETNRQLKSIVVVKEITEACQEQASVIFENMFRGAIARAQLSAKLDCIQVADLSEPKRVKEAEFVNENLNSYFDAVRDFIGIHYNQFYEGYLSKQARLDVADYIMNVKKYPNPGAKTIQAIMRRYLLKQRNQTNGWVYKFKPGTELEFKPTIEVKTNEDEQHASGTSAPLAPDVVGEFFSTEKIRKLVTAPGGFMSEKLSLRFRTFVERECVRQYGIDVNTYTSKFGSLSMTHCIQIFRNGKRWHIQRETDEAKQYISELETLIKTELGKNKHLNVTEFLAMYNTRNVRITRNIVFDMFNQIQLSFTNKRK